MQAQCKATARSGEQCSNPPISGGTVCRMHGGSAPAVKAAAARRKAAEAVEAEAQAILAHEGFAGVESPLEELSRLANEALAVKNASAARVNALTSISTTSKLGVESLAVEVALYERAMDRAAKFLDMLTKSGFEERRLRVAEGTAGLVVQVLKAIFERLNLSPEQQALIPIVVPQELRALEVK
ncbi:HGGxSTG domain-containing protein [Arthrobacter bambusae]|uniref:HGGxSTG domain-containing protein n=1 Tax=Arthrobacter bambusae TaxID=1338426 RepID=UPI0027875ED4|nr:HGGxSTG domain-containing protein [Arthrobacter bambusae]MDQ0030175.1 hypothetical protein [Arthrobacter bambusae]MDQ0097857.1 hypothetical protein [Arthrobacter bambusae]